MEANDKAIRATIREFAEQIRGISPSMKEIQVAIAVERLRDEHGIEVSESKLARLAR